MFGWIKPYLNMALARIVLSVICLAFLALKYPGLDSYFFLSVLPVAVYPDADTDKALAIKENKKRSGVYL